MPIVVNGTTIPENVANVLNVNGTNITSVVCNGVTVWTQNLFSATWSGNSIANVIGFYMGIETSGSSWRWYDPYGGNGSWQTVSPLGIFSGNSLQNHASRGFYASGNKLATFGGYTGAFTWCSFTLNTKSFSGSSSATENNPEGGSNDYYLSTSGGLIRWGGSQGSTYWGPYISLT